MCEARGRVGLFMSRLGGCGTEPRVGQPPNPYSSVSEQGTNMLYDH